MTDTTSLLAREFPDFDATTLPAIPAHWLENHWHNDTCPCWQLSDTHYVYIDYPDPALREWPDRARFTLHHVPEEGDTECLVDSDNWNDILYTASVL